MPEDKRWEIYEYEKVPPNTILFVGIPDVGLVGSIAASFLARSLNLKLKQGIDSDYLPPILLYHQSKPCFPVRIYANSEVSVFISEVAIPLSGMYSLVRFIVDWCIDNKVRQAVILSGIPVPNRLNIEKPSVYAAVTNEDQLKELEAKGVKPLKEGFMGGVHALLLKECIKRGFPALALLAESHLNYPDPGAAASLISKLKDLFNIDVDVKPLLEQEEELRIKLRELMRRTVESMRQSGKAYEYTIPHLYA